jgi:hypothetical protein
VQSTQNLKESLNDVILLASGAETEILSHTSEGRQKGNAMTRAGMVLLCGYFEGYIRDVIAEFAEIVNDEKISINMLPDEILLFALEDIASTNGTNKLQDSLKLQTSIVSDSHFKINAKKLSKTGGNPTVDTIESIFSKLGISNIIDTLSIEDFGISSTYTRESQALVLRAKIEEQIIEHAQQFNSSLTDHIVSIIEEKWAPTLKRRQIGYVFAIGEILRIRNLIAHGEGREPVAPTDLLEHITIIENLVFGLDKNLNNLLARIRTSA